MKNKLLLSLILIFAFSIAEQAQSVVITAKKTTYTRPKPLNEYKKTFTINYPHVKASTPALSKKIEAAISYSSIVGLSLKDELGDTQWLEEADYEVKYNKNGLLTIDLSMNGSGAYPSGITKTVVVDLRRGVRLKAADVFSNLPGLAAMIKQAQKKEIAASIAAIRKDPESKDLDPSTFFANAKYTQTNLNDFSVGDKGVTFKYDYEFPHVIQALQPDGAFFYTWAELKPFIRRGGLLTRIAR